MELNFNNNHNKVISKIKKILFFLEYIILYFIYFIDPKD